MPDRLRLLQRAMAIGSLAFAAAGLLAPVTIGRLAGVAPRTARLLALRDAVVAGLLLRPGGPAGLAARGVSDLGDAVLMARRRPALAAFAGLSGAANLVAVLGTGRAGGRRRA